MPGDEPRVAPRDWGYWSRVFVRYWASILLTTAVVIGAATVVEQAQTPLYTAQATVAVYVSSPINGAQAFVMGTEKGIASSGAVLSVASKSLLIPVTKLQHGLSVTVPADTDLLVISYSDPDPVVAQSAAEGIAHAYVAYRASTNPTTPTSPRNGTATATTGVSAAVITDAVLPTSPAGPNRLLVIGAAAAVGLALGLGLALLRDWMDDRLRDHFDLEIQADAPVLAQIPAAPRQRRGTSGPLTVVNSPNSRAADAYLSLRTRVLHAAGPRQADTVLVTSPGGEDKATIAANLAAALALSGRKVVLVCADPRWGRADALFGMEREAGVTSVVHGDATLANALRATVVPQLRVLPSGPAYAASSSVSQSPAFQELLTKLRSEVDFIVIDAPPVLASADAGALAGAGTMLLLVADARTTTRSRVRAAAGELSHLHDEVIGWVLDHERAVRRLGEPSSAGQMQMAVAPAPPIALPQAIVPRSPIVPPPPIVAPQPRALTWDDISGDSVPPKQNLVAVPSRHRTSKSASSKKTTSNGSYQA